MRKVSFGLAGAALRLKPLLLTGMITLLACTRSASSLAPLSPTTAPIATQSPRPSVPPTAVVTAAPSAAFTPTHTPPPTTPPIHEAPVTPIALAGPLAAPQAKISAMAWFGEQLILLPQHPEQALFSLAKSQLLAYLGGEQSEPLVPQTIPFDSAAVSQSIPGFAGFAAIALQGNTAYLIFHTRPDPAGDELRGFLVRGELGPELSGLTLLPAYTPILPQAALPGMATEALLVFGQRLVTFFPANGRALNPDPFAQLFDSDLQLLDRLSFPQLEYRLTDVTSPDENGRFWGINTFSARDLPLATQADPLAAQYGVGASHAQSSNVERLVEFQFTEAGVEFSGAPPIPLQLMADGNARHWEAIARLENGFLLATGQYTPTLLAFVAVP